MEFLHRGFQDGGMNNETREHWKIADLPWDQFDASKVEPAFASIVKAAALVEYNASDYAAYLSHVFPDDAEFRQKLQVWAAEERQHGEGLGMWAEKADPTFNFKAAAERYCVGYRIDVNADASVRGSQCGELVARCIVETATSSYYTALGDATEEPTLKALCRAIAADEIRHYRLFQDHLRDYLSREKLGRWSRLKIGLGRVQESEDDELAFAYFAANAPSDAVYNRVIYSSAYMVRAYPLYRPEHVERVIVMVFRACGFKLPRFVRRGVRAGAHALMQAKVRQALVCEKLGEKEKAAFSSLAP
jgi:rubrerythrin